MNRSQHCNKKKVARRVCLIYVKADFYLLRTASCFHSHSSTFSRIFLFSLVFYVILVLVLQCGGELHLKSITELANKQNEVDPVLKITSISCSSLPLVLLI